MAELFFFMHLIQTLDAARPVVAPQARRRSAATRSRSSGRCKPEQRLAFDVLPVKQFAAHRSEEVLEDQAAAEAVRPGSRPPLHDFAPEVELRFKPACVDWVSAKKSRAVHASSSTRRRRRGRRRIATLGWARPTLEFQNDRQGQ